MTIVGVVLRALIIGRKHVFHVFHGDLALGHHAPRQIVGFGGEVRVGAVPHEGSGIQAAQHIPRPGRVVAVIRVAVAAQRRPNVEVLRFRRVYAVQAQIQMVFPDEVRQIGRAEVILSFAQRVLEVKIVDSLLIGDDHVSVVGHPFGHPVVAADGFQPPDLVQILKTDAVHFVGAVLLQQRAQPQHAFPGAVDVGQHDGEHVLLADTAFHQRIGPQHPRVGGQGLRFAHGHVAFVDAGLAPDALHGNRVGHGGVAHGIVRQVDLHLGNDAAVVPGLLVGMNDDKFFGGESSRAGVLVAGH